MKIDPAVHEFFNSISEAILVLESASGLILEANRAASDLYGYSHDELLCLGILDLSCEPARTIAALKDSPGHVPCRKHKKKSGERICAEITHSPAVLSGIELVVVMIRDITERVNDDESLRNSREQLEFAIEGSGLGLWDWNISTGEVIINERWAAMLGYTARELAPVDIGVWERLTHPDDLGRARERIESHFSGASPSYECEIRMRHRDGRWVWVHDRGRIAERDAAGKPLRMIGTHSNITERKQESAELARNAKKYMQLLEFSNDGYWAVNGDDETTYVNNRLCEITGYSKNELIGSKISGHINMAGAEKFVEAIRKAGRGERIVFNYELVHREGFKKYVSVTASPRYDDFGKFCGAFALIDDFTREKELEKEIFAARKELLGSYNFNDIIGRSQPMRRLFDSLPVIAETDCNVLIEGASGTGKNLVAKVINNISSRKDLPFVTVNCGTLPETLLESELFGFVRGAFTGADRDKPGKFAVAGAGTIFIDEIGELPLDLQVKLLRVIDEKRFEPIGSNKTVRMDARVIAATNRDLAALVGAGKFRSDLYYRLNIVKVKLPPLRERTGDIELLTEFFMERFNEKYHRRVKRISGELLKFLTTYQFPGNIRELSNMLERAFIFCNDETLTLEHIDPEYGFLTETVSRNTAECSAILRNNAMGDETQNGVDHGNDEKAKIIEAINVCGGNKSLAADTLNIDKTTLWRKMKKYGLEYLMGRSTAGSSDDAGAPTDGEEKVELKGALEKAGGNRSEAAKLLGISRITLWRKLKKHGLV